MEPTRKNKNTIRLILWSVIAIGFGIAFSGLVVHTVTNFKSGEEPGVVRQNLTAKALALADKVKDWSKIGRTSASGTIGDINFDGIALAPQAAYHLKDKELLPKVGALAYYVGDASTGQKIIGKNEDQVLPIASVTKLMTTLVSLEEIDQNETAKVSAKAINTNGYSGALSQGEKIKIGDLNFPILLVSSNDATEVVAEHVGREKFMGLMNKWAKDIGMEKTNYKDPSGLSADNYSTAEDLFKLASYLFTKHKTVFNISGLDRYTLNGHTWLNANPFSRRDDYLGGKTGYTDRAKRTGVAIFSTEFEGYDPRPIAITLLKTDDRTRDINNILEYLKTNVYYSYDEKIAAAEGAEVTLGFVGDMMLDRGVETSVIKNFGGNYSKIFSEVKALEDDDILFANLEGPISDKGRNVGSKYSFRFDPVVTSVIKEAGFDIVSFANNHVGDYSDAAFLDTLGRLSENNILVTGAGETYELAKKPTIIERNGIKIGYLGFSDVGPEWMKATEAKPGILLANDPNLETIIKEASESVDFLVVSVHWGDEYKTHNKRQEALAHKIIDNGAKLVVGHHPHVTQDVEEYKDGLILYSLGNFVFDQYFSAETMQGQYALVTIGKSGIKDHVETIFKINKEYQPVIQDASALTERFVFQRGVCPIGNSDSDQIFANVNQENSVEEYIPEGLVAIREEIPTKDGRDVCMTEEAATAMKRMYNDAIDNSVDIMVTSGFRSHDSQEVLYTNNQKLQSDDEEESVAKPGHSEHQLGTTVDLSTPEVNGESASARFKSTETYKWLDKNAYRYGFVLSYPADKDTGYIEEPWHWRYLGVDIAKEINEKGITIQEYLESL